MPLLNRERPHLNFILSALYIIILHISVLTMNMERKLLRSVNSSSTEVFFGSMAKNSSKFWYSVSMLLCIITNLPYCSRAVLLKLWGLWSRSATQPHCINLLSTVLLFEGGCTQCWLAGNKYITRHMWGSKVKDGLKTLANQSCDTVSQAITTVFSRLQPPAANSICDSTVAAACWLLWHANVTLKQKKKREYIDILYSTCN